MSGFIEMEMKSKISNSRIVFHGKTKQELPVAALGFVYLSMCNISMRKMMITQNVKMDLITSV